MFNGALKLWGIIYFYRELSPLKNIPIGLPELRHFAPDSLTIEILAPGSLKITRSHAVIGRIEKGEFKPSIPTPIGNPHAMGSILFDLFSIHTNGNHFSSENDVNRKSIIFQCLEYFIDKLDKKSGGATIIFVKNTYTDEARDKAIFPWEVTGNIEFEKLIQRKHIPTHKKPVH